MPKSMTDKELEKYVEKIIDQAVEDIMEDAFRRFKPRFVDLLEKSVDQFYEDFHPTVYDRTDDFKKGAKKGYVFQKKKNGFRVEAIPDYVHEHPGWNKKNPWPRSGEDIWDDAFMHGIHGHEMFGTTEPPYSLIGKSIQEIMDESVDEAMNAWVPKI